MSVSHSFTDLSIEYIERLQALLDAVNFNHLEVAKTCIEEAKTVYVAGNGGSYANATHLVLHLRENGRTAVDLMADNSVVSAYSNDFAYEKVLYKQLRLQGQPSDILVLFSGSGDSPNIVMAATEAKRIGMPVVGFLGFGGGMVKGLCDNSVVFDVKEYGIIEDGHSAIVHIISNALRG